MGQCLMRSSKKYKQLEKDKIDRYSYSFDKRNEPKQENQKSNVAKKKELKNSPKSERNDWVNHYYWSRSEASNRAERRVRKMRYLTQCELDAGKRRRKIGAAYGGRRKKSSNRIPNDRAIKQDRKRRRQRQIRDSLVMRL